MLDRTVAPKAEKIEKISIPEFNKRNLKNGIPLYFLNSGSQDVIKIEIILNAGVKYEQVSGTSYIVSRLLTSGTSQISASEIATKLDYYGAFTETTSSFDHINIAIHCLNKFQKPVLELIKALITDSTFPEDEMQTAISQKISELAISKKKDSMVSSKRFRQNLFGLSHSYGKILSEDDLKSITHQNVTDFYKNVFLNEPVIIVSGLANEQSLNQISNTFENLEVVNVLPQNSEISSMEKHQVIKRPESVQSSLKIGKLIINKHHKDIHRLHITTSVLGGYFGSRLMKNIREDKGYTYGIGANIAHLQDASFLLISTDIVKQHTVDTINEVEKEIRILQEELIDHNELETVKNYLTGKFLSGIDSPFNIAAKFKAVLISGLDYEYYNDFLKTLSEITPEDIQLTAQKYFELDSLNSVIVGERI